jgi:hypothetical protein
MMQMMGDGGVFDIISLFSEESHKERLWAYSHIACESPSFFPGHLISSQLVPKYIC